MAVAWSAVALLGVTMFGMFGVYLHLAAKIDSRGRDLRGALDAHGTALNARMDAPMTQLQAHIERHAG